MQADQPLFLQKRINVTASVSFDCSINVNQSNYRTLEDATSDVLGPDSVSSVNAEWLVDYKGRRFTVGELLSKVKKFPKNGAPRYSSTHPLIPYVIDCPGVDGNIIMSQCPGIRERGREGEFWIRDVKTDLDCIAEWNVSAIVGLLEPQEALGVGVWDLEKQTENYTFQYYSLPIPRYQAPHGAVLSLLHATIEHISDYLKAGQNVMIFCDTDMGRAGMVAAKVLTKLGLSAEAAVGIVRAKCPNAMESPDQEELIMRVSQEA